MPCCDWHRWHFLQVPCKAKKITWSDLESSQNLAGRSMTKPPFLLDVVRRTAYLIKTPYALYGLALSAFL